MLAAGDRETGLSLGKVMERDLDKQLAAYDNQLFRHLQKREYDECEQVLTDFCFELIDLSEKEQVFIAKVFYVSLVTEIIRTLNRKKRLHPRRLANAYQVIFTIEKWENLSEYILYGHWLMEQIKERIMEDDVFNGDQHIDKALQIIDKHLVSETLTVKWLAAKLNISTTHLGNLFKITVGETVSAYITRRKLNEIVFEMTYTSKSLKEIRIKYGYHNHSHFIQHFKRHLGTTPLKYKKQLMDEF